jgi:GTP pyrophosphokinase
MDDRPGMLNDLTKVLSDENSNIRTLEARQDTSWGGAAVVDMTIEVRDNKHLQRISAAMRRLSGVHEVQRL